LGRSFIWVLTKFGVNHVLPQVCPGSYEKLKTEADFMGLLLLKKQEPTYAESEPHTSRYEIIKFLRFKNQP
jgi:hypothetical protein